MTPLENLTGYTDRHWHMDLDAQLKITFQHGLKI